MARATFALGCKIVCAALLAVTMAGCASDGNGGGGQYAKPLPVGQSCGGIREELRRLDNRGVPDKVERLNSGQSMSAGDRQQAERYNQLLNSYLAARCHV